MLLIKNKRIRQIIGLLETFSPLTMKLALRNRKALRTFPGKIYREYRYAAKAGPWKAADIFDIIDPPGPITIEHMKGGGINTYVDELAYLALLAKSLNPTKIFEIGTFLGRTALNFARNTPPECVVYTLDLPPTERDIETNQADKSIISHSKTGIDYQGKDGEAKIHQLYGDSTKYDFSSFHNSIDLVFVDGAHHYEAVLLDTQNALKMVKPGGMIVWHDWGNYGDYNDVVRAALDTIPGERITQIGNSQLAVYMA